MMLEKHGIVASHESLSIPICPTMAI